jgi:hypothetical protein
MTIILTSIAGGGTLSTGGGTTILTPIAGGGGPLNRKQLRDAVARVFGLWEGGTTGGSHSTVADSVRLARYADDYFVGCQVYLETTDDGLAPQGELSFVTDFVGSTGLCTISPAFTNIVQDCDFYQLYRWTTKEDIDRALGDACAGVDIAVTLPVKTDSVDYYISDLIGLSRASQITGVWLRDKSDIRYQPMEVFGWQLEDAETQLVLRLPGRLTDSRDQLWITYKGDGQYMTADTQYVNLPLPVVVARACVLLIEQMMAQNDAGGQERWGTMLRYWSEKQARLEKTLQPARGHVKNMVWAPGSFDDQSDVALGLQPNY